MLEDSPAEHDYAPFPEPFPQIIGLGPVDVENVREWMARRDEWEAVHGKSSLPTGQA